MEKVVVSAPGKVILFGEHSVVYGRRAIALSVDLRTKLTVTFEPNKVLLVLPDVNIDTFWNLEQLTNIYNQLQLEGQYNEKYSEPQKLSIASDKILRSFLRISDVETNPKSLALLSFFHLYFSIIGKPKGLKFKVESDIPIGAGLGSSAAYSVCLAGALLKLSKNIDFKLINSHILENDLNQPLYDQICKWAYCSEQILHGSPSGIDNSICTYGKGISFKNGGISPIKVPSFDILLVDTTVPRNTSALVKSVKELHSNYNDIVEPILTSMNAIAEMALEVLNSLECSNNISNSVALYDKLYNFIDINHALLCSLGVSHVKLDQIVNIARSHNLHAKLTGAGGGGFGFVLIGKEVTKESVSKCKANLQAEGFKVWTTRLGVPGVTLE